MFDHVVLRRAEGGDPISVGQIIEALLYYQRVHLVLERGTLFALIKQIGPDRVLTLLQRPEISAVYCEEMLGTHTDSVGAFQVHGYVAFTFSGHESVGALKSPEERLAFELQRIPLDSKTAKRFARQFLQRVPIRKLSGRHFLPEGIPQAAKRDLLDGGFIKNAVRLILTLTPGGYDPGVNFKFDVFDTDLGIHVFHGLDLNLINQRRAALIPSVEPLTIAHILSQIQDARADLALASFYSGDFVTSAAVSAVIQVRHGELLRRSGLNTEAKNQFVEIILPDTPTVSEVVNAGERSFEEALLLVDKAQRFKHWLRSVSPDEGLVRTYMRDISSEGWVQRLPAKSIRYMISLALDATNPIAGLVAGFADNFIVEKLLGGWRPNHFLISHDSQPCPESAARVLAR